MDHCERCGCTSVIMREGRPYGPKSGLWDWIVAEFREVFSPSTRGSSSPLSVIRQLSRSIGKPLTTGSMKTLPPFAQNSGIGYANDWTKNKRRGHGRAIDQRAVASYP
jgi:hypothetical protein